MSRRSVVAGGALAAALICTSGAQAGFTILGNSGWRADWDSSLDPFVQINFVAVNFGVDAVFIQKSAEFTQGPVNGIFPSIPVVFTQIAPNANTVHNIVIDDEIIHNSTGTAWTDFHMDLLDHGEVQFDPVHTAASGGGGPIGFSIAPFTTAAFTPDLARLDIAGGTIPNGGLWFPGSGANDGQLWIHVNSLNGSTSWTLKETPTPAPGALALLGMAAVLGFGRRRRTA
jgi:MYXO-CTERM domain-containing protein